MNKKPEDMLEVMLRRDEYAFLTRTTSHRCHKCSHLRGLHTGNFCPICKEVCHVGIQSRTNPE